MENAYDSFTIIPLYTDNMSTVINIMFSYCLPVHMIQIFSLEYFITFLIFNFIDSFKNSFARMEQSYVFQCKHNQTKHNQAMCISCDTWCTLSWY